MKELFEQKNKSFLMLNPRTSQKEREIIEKAHSHFKDHHGFFIRSSGTESSSSTGAIKLVYLSMQAFLVAANSVNNHLQINEKDYWLNPLPRFHVGGLSIGARCFLSGAKEEIVGKWDVRAFYAALNLDVTITSLVPTQVYDLVNNKMESPPSLRLVLLGGGAISQDLYTKAIELGWPLLPSYGMTETCAMMAGASLSHIFSLEIPPMELLDHVSLTEVEEKFSIKSDSLFNGYLWVYPSGDFNWQERPSPFVLDDRIELKGKQIKILGRQSELIKVLGESVNIRDLEHRLTTLLQAPCAVVAIPDERRSYRLQLFIEKEHSSRTLEEINCNLMPFERIDKVYWYPSFPRTALGKVIKSEFKI